MWPDGFDEWKKDVRKHLPSRDDSRGRARGRAVNRDESPRAARSALSASPGDRRDRERERDRRDRPEPESPRQKRQAALENPHAPQPGHPPTARQVALGAAPNFRGVNYIPPREKGGKKIWDGRRDGLGFGPNVMDTMPDRATSGCFHQYSGCTGIAEAIDHKVPFSRRQSELPRYRICDGRNHFDACFKDEVQQEYDAPELVWSCTKCNSSKSGDKGLYENQPRFIEPCPRDGCDVPRGGRSL
jgi:hypothetical protein